VTLTSEDADCGSVKIDDGEAGATASKTVAAGTQVTIQAISASGYSFERWSDSNNNGTRTITVNSNLNLTASFGIGD